MGTSDCDTNPMENPYKFGTPDPEDRQFKYPNVWATENTSDGGSRLIVAPETDQVECLIRLLDIMSGPFFVAVRTRRQPRRQRVGQVSEPPASDERRSKSLLEGFPVIP